MSAQVVLATRNAHKGEELARILAKNGLEIDLKLVADFPGAPEVAETETTFTGNALLKARALCAFTGLPAIADDSGLCVEVLGGMPGIFSARWSGAAENVDDANLQLVLKQIAEIAPEHRGAKFVCAAVLVLPDGREFTALGEVPGVIVSQPIGENGFGYDPIFKPNGFEITTAQMTAEEKDEISHRSRALRELAKMMAEIF